MPKHFRHFTNSRVDGASNAEADDERGQWRAGMHLKVGARVRR